MNRDSDFRPEDDSPLANSTFFRQVEESQTNPAQSANADEPDWEDEALDDEESFDEAELDSVLDDEDEDHESDEDEFADEPMATGEDDSSRGSTGVLAMALGWTIGGAGLGLAALSIMAPSSVEPLLTGLSSAQVHPVHLVVVGVVLAVYGSLRRELAHRGATNETEFAQLDLAIERMEAAAHEHRERREEEELSDSERLLLALERQDGKINNLTRATKLYGKPLVEISKQVSELTAQVQDLDGLAAQIEKVIEVTRSNDSAVEKLQKDISEDLDLHWEETRKMISEGFSSHDSGVGDSFEQQNAKLAELSKSVEGQGRPLAGFSDQMREVTDRISGLAKTLADMHATAEERQPATTDLSPLDKQMTKMLGQMQRLTQRVDDVASRPAPTAPAAQPSPTPQSAASEPAPVAPSEAPASKPAPDGLAHSISGKREAKGANVLGAIAKLKSMRG